MNRMQLSPASRMILVLICLSVCTIVSCTDPVPVKPKRPVETSIAVGSENNCIVWSHDDSLAMKVVYQAWSYDFEGHRDKALVLYKHVCTMKHDLPGIFLYTGVLYLFDNDTVSARNYFLQELEHDLRVLKTDLPDCRKYEFRQMLDETRSLLKRQPNSYFYFGKTERFDPLLLPVVDGQSQRER